MAQETPEPHAPLQGGRCRPGWKSPPRQYPPDQQHLDIRKPTIRAYRFNWSERARSRGRRGRPSGS
jgi:hypothetical protein